MAELDEGKGLMPFAANISGGLTQIKGKKVTPIGTLDDFLKIYTTVKQVQKLIDFKANYITKDGYFIASRNEENKKKVEEFFRTIAFEEIIEIWAKHSMIYGNAFLEWTGNNLIPRDARKMVIYIDEEGHGKVVGYVQEVGNDPNQYPTFEPEDIVMLKNNPLDHLRGLSEFIGYDEIINLDSQAMEDIGATLNRQVYPRKHFIIGSKEQPIPINSDKFEAAQELIGQLQPGEDIVTNHEITVADVGAKQAGDDFDAYVRMINERMTMESLVPSDFWFGSSSGETIKIRKQIFEETEIMTKRRKIEEVINREIIPRIVSANPEEPVWFKFGDINTEMAFIKAKIDLTHLQTGAKTPEELRLERGLDPVSPEQLAAQAASGQKQQIPISAKDETAKGNIGGNLTGARPAQ